MSSAEPPLASSFDRARLLPGMRRQLDAMHVALANGAPRLGWKVGINVPSVQRSLGVSHALVGWIDGRKVLPSDAVFTIAESSLPHAEPELAIRLAANVPPDASASDARRAIAAVAPAFEIVDYARGGMELDELLAHSMFHAGTVLGTLQPLPAALDEAGREWPVVVRESKAPMSPRDDLVPRDLGALVAAVARYLGEFGEALLAGDTILSGSFTERAVRLEPGGRLVAEFGSLGPVSIFIAQK